MSFYMLFLLQLQSCNQVFVGSMLSYHSRNTFYILSGKMSAYDTNASCNSKRIFTFSACCNFTTIPVSLSYCFIFYFLESAPATRMEFSGRHKSCRGRQYTSNWMSWQGRKESSYLVFAKSNHTLVSSICCCKYVGGV